MHVGRLRHIFVLRFDVGTLGEQLVDQVELELAVQRRIVEGGVAKLR
jgi:hypothetical protein